MAETLEELAAREDARFSALMVALDVVLRHLPEKAAIIRDLQGTLSAMQTLRPPGLGSDHLDELVSYLATT